MDDFFRNNPDSPCKRFTAGSNTLSLAAGILGAAAVISVISGGLLWALMGGGLAIILAVLSRGESQSLDKPAKVGLVLGLAGSILGVCLFFYVVYAVIYVPEYREQFNLMYEQLYGMPLDEALDSIYEGTDFPLGEGGEL